MLQTHEAMEMFEKGKRGRGRGSSRRSMSFDTTWDLERRDANDRASAFLNDILGGGSDDEEEPLEATDFSSSWTYQPGVRRRKGHAQTASISDLSLMVRRGLSFLRPKGSQMGESNLQMSLLESNANSNEDEYGDETMDFVEGPFMDEVIDESDLREYEPPMSSGGANDGDWRGRMESGRLDDDEGDGRGRMESGRLDDDEGDGRGRMESDHFGNRRQGSRLEEQIFADSRLDTEDEEDQEPDCIDWFLGVRTQNLDPEYATELRNATYAGGYYVATVVIGLVILFISAKAFTSDEYTIKFYNRTCDDDDSVSEWESSCVEKTGLACARLVLAQERTYCAYTRWSMDAMGGALVLGSIYKFHKFCTPMVWALICFSFSASILGTTEYYYVVSEIHMRCKGGFLTSADTGGAIQMSITFELLLLFGIFVLMLIMIYRLTSNKAANTMQIIMEYGLIDM